MRVERAVEHRLFGMVALVIGAVCWVVKRRAMNHGRSAARSESVPIERTRQAMAPLVAARDGPRMRTTEPPL